MSIFNQQQPRYLAHNLETIFDENWAGNDEYQKLNFLKIAGVAIKLIHAHFIHATPISVMLNFWEVGVAPTTLLYIKSRYTHDEDWYLRRVDAKSSSG